MKRKYYVRKGDFANVYSLGYADTDAEIAMAESGDWEQITRKEAERLCRAERTRQKEEPAFSGYADDVILPISYPAADRDWRNDRCVYLNDCIVERK